MSLISQAQMVTDVKAFIKNASSGNSMKYSPKQNSTDYIYFPFFTETVVDENGNQQTVRRLFARIADVHNWKGADGKNRATVCMAGITRYASDNKTLLNKGGKCPICERVQDAWGIYNYRKELLEKSIGNSMVGDARKNYIDKVAEGYRKELKVREKQSTMYVLIAVFKKDENDAVVINKDTGLPDYQLKMMKLGGTRTEKIMKQLKNSQQPFEGAEISIEYGDEEDKMYLVGQSTIACLYGPAKVVEGNTQLIDRITKECMEFDWEGITKIYPEWFGITDEEAEDEMNKAFDQWDKYSKEIKMNPNAKYLEYTNTDSTSNPELQNVMSGNTLQIPGQMMGTPNGAPVGQNTQQAPMMGQMMGAPVGAPNGQAPVQQAPVGTQGVQGGIQMPGMNLDQAQQNVAQAFPQ